MSCFWMNPLRALGSSHRVLSCYLLGVSPLSGWRPLGRRPCLWFSWSLLLSAVSPPVPRVRRACIHSPPRSLLLQPLLGNLAALEIFQPRL